MLSDNEILTITNDGDFYRAFCTSRNALNRYYAVVDAVKRAKQHHPGIPHGNNARLTEAYEQMLEHYAEELRYHYTNTEHEIVMRLRNKTEKPTRLKTSELNGLTLNQACAPQPNQTPENEMTQPKMFEEVAFLNGSKLLDTPHAN